MKYIDKIFNNGLKMVFLGYKRIISPWLGVNCRFHPTCSEYCKTAVERHGIIKGGVFSIYRLIRCNPWGGSGIDEVPERKNDK